MWKLDKVEATNLCSFHSLSYCPIQDVTTLIYGCNKDNDSQGSNGSGKSALLEAIAIGLTGESLRKVKMDEIINDHSNETTILLLLTNSMTKATLTIRRTISRKQPQSIQLLVSEQPVVCATVSDYNQRILEIIGLTKDDLFSNFILSKHKYVPFLSCSDREKKEIINRFSNGVLIDSSIESLIADMVPVEEEYEDSLMHLSMCNGKLSSAEEQLREVIEEHQRNEQNREAKRAELQNHIAEQQKSIRECSEVLRQEESWFNKADVIQHTLDGLSENPVAISDAYNKLKEMEPTLLKTDYVASFQDKQNQLREREAELENIQQELQDAADECKFVNSLYLDTKQKAEEQQSQCDIETSQLEEQMEVCYQYLYELEQQWRSLSQQKVEMESHIGHLNTLLSGVIKCPYCSKEWLVKTEEYADVESVQKELDKSIAILSNTTKQSKQSRQQMEQINLDISVLRDKRTQIQRKSKGVFDKYETLRAKICSANEKHYSIQSNLAKCQNKIQMIQDSISHIYNQMIDEAYDNLDRGMDIHKERIQSIKSRIALSEGMIANFEDSLSNIDNTYEDMLANLTKNRNKYYDEQQTAIQERDKLESEYNTLKKQEQLFIGFKTHLANTRIDALSRMTNQFLEAIGSDLRVELSGFTVLKSGKVRDKISITLIRDGVCLGSFDKMSEGEKTRVNLANILAMHSLSNSNSAEGGGLDLLILDEILEATDEQGLASIFKALNDLHITTLAVSHGNIAEGYPYKRIVVKQHGVSSIYNG